MPAPRDPEQRFSLVSLLVLALALSLVGLSAAQLAYRLAQPTDGWTAEADPSGQTVLSANVLGADSPLRSGDVLLALNGQPMLLTTAPQWLFAFEDRLPAGWTAGARVPYQVLRDGQALTVEVTLQRWRAAPLLARMGDPFYLGLTLLAPIAAFAFLLRPANWGARALFICAASVLAALLSGLVNATTDPLLAIAPLTIFFTFVSWALLTMPTFFLITLSFPHPKRFLAQRPALALLVIYGAAPLLIALSGNLGFGWVLAIAWAALSLVSVAHSAWTVRDAVGRAQLRWAAAGVAVGAAGLIANNLVVLAISAGWLSFPPGSDRWYDSLPGALAIIAPALGFGIAITRYRLFDIDVIIRRTLLYAVLTGLLAAVYLGSVVALQGLLRPLTGQAQNQLVTVLSTLAIAALFVPLRRRVQAVLDRRFYRRKYHAGQTLAAFGSHLRDETDLETLSARLVSVVDETMQPASVSLWYRPPEK